VQALGPFGRPVRTRLDIQPLVLHDILVLLLIGIPVLLDMLAQVLDDMVVVLDRLVQKQ
jgi:hypothetical protein